MGLPLEVGIQKKLCGAFASNGLEQFLEGVFGHPKELIIAGNFTQNVKSVLLKRWFVTFVRRILRVHTGQRKPEKPEKPGN